MHHRLNDFKCLVLIAVLASLHPCIANHHEVPCVLQLSLLSGADVGFEASAWLQIWAKGGCSKHKPSSRGGAGKRNLSLMEVLVTVISD